MKKLKLFEGSARQKIYEYKLLKDYSIEELAEVVRNCRLPEPNEEDQWLLDELEYRLDKVFGYEEKYGTTDTCSVLNEIRDGKYYSWEEYRDWLLKEIDRYRSIVNESRNPRKATKKLKLFEGLVKQKINEQIDYDDQNIWTRWEGYSYDFGFKYAYLRDKPTKELLELVNRGELSPYATEEEKCAYCEIKQRLFKAFGEEYEIRFGSDYKGLGLSYILTKLYNTDDRSYGLKDILEWLNEEVEFYISFVNESKQKINESLEDKSAKELFLMIKRGEFSTDKEESDLVGALESKLVKVFGDEYEMKYGTTYLESVFAKIDGGSDYAWRDFVDWLSGEVDRYQRIVNESKKAVNESRNPRKGDIIVIDGDLEVKVLHSFTSAKSAAAYERRANITKDDGYSISEKIKSGVIDSNESGLYVYGLYEDKIKLFDFTDEDVDWEIKDKK